MINIILTSTADHLEGYFNKEAGFNVRRLLENRENRRHFPDGEVYVRIPNINEINGRTVIIHAGAPGANDGLVELEMILEILKESKAQPVEVLFSYFPYCMQDKVFEEGETAFAEDIIKKLFNYYKINRLYIVEAHFAKEDWVEKYPIVHISTLDLLIKKAKEDDPGIVFIAPDKGSQRRTGLVGAQKVRNNSFSVDIKAPENLKPIVDNQVVGVIDDLVETGGTLCKFYDECKKMGAKKVVALITHGVLQEGIDRLNDKYDKVYLTNTIDRAHNVDLSNLMIEKILKD